MEEGKNSQKTPSRSFVTGAIALVFLIIGYEVAVFINKAAVTRIEAKRDKPDTVYVYMSGDVSGDVPVGGSGGGKASPSSGPGTSLSVRKNASHSEVVEAVRSATRRVESFRFNPNTVSLEDLQRLGFSEKQAQSIDNYRSKGGKFRRKEDFARSYVVSDSVYARLEPFIDIPLLDINAADSVAFLDLPGVGPFFAGKMVAYREQLGGYSCPEQLMEIWHFDKEKFDGLRDLISCSAPEPFGLWTLPAQELAKHPHISFSEARAIVLYREHHSPEDCTIDGLAAAGVLSPDHASRLQLCRIAPIK